MEFFAPANHRKAIRAELASYAEQFRRLQAEALGDALASHPTDPAVPPEALLLLVTAVSQVLVLEEALGVTTGHPEVRD